MRDRIGQAALRDLVHHGMRLEVVQVHRTDHYLGKGDGHRVFIHVREMRFAVGGDDVVDLHAEGGVELAGRCIYG